MAHAFAYAGHEVKLIDSRARNAEQFAALKEEVLAEVGGSLAMMAAIGAFPAEAVPTILSRVSVVPQQQAGAALSAAHFIFEAVPETLEAKRDALALIDANAGPDAIVASTTSTFLSTDLAAMTTRPGRFLNAHWLNPAFLVPLIEISPNSVTETAVTIELCTFLEEFGKVPVVCKASPGYIVPRIQALAMNEAARLVEEGVASTEDIDKAVLYGFGLRFAVLGLLEFIDWGGGDILYHASRYLTEATGENRFAAPEVVTRNMAEGRIGMKTGSGFYDWSSRDIPAHRQQRLAAFLELIRARGLVRPPVL